MKKRKLRVVTIAALLAALFGSGGGIAWGQTVPDCNNDYGADEWAKISTSASASPFYPATPTSGIPWNSSGVFSGPTGAPNTWSSNVAVAGGSRGRITLGGNQKQNVIYNIRNYASAGFVAHVPNTWHCNYTYSDCGNVTWTTAGASYCSGAQYDKILHPSWSGSGPDNGTTTVANNFYNRETQVRILGNTSAGAWVEMDHILMEDIEWWYRQKALEWSACTATGSGCNNQYHGTPPYGYTACDACSSTNATGYTSWIKYDRDIKGGNVDGHVILDAGATVSLTSDIIGIRNTAGGTYPGGGAATGSLLDLPANDPYTPLIPQYFFL